MCNFWITSDWHFCHDKPFLYEPRGFSSVSEMNEAIIKNHNEVVKFDDIVFCLGDCMLNDDKAGLDCIRRLNGKIYIIGGNHDTENRIKQYSEVAPNIIQYLGLATRIKHKGYKFYLSHYPTLTSNYDFEKPLKQRTINLCGHSHTKDKFQDMDKGVIYHCELDCHDNRPVLLDNIIDDLKEYQSTSLM